MDVSRRVLLVGGAALAAGSLAVYFTTNQGPTPPTDTEVTGVGGWWDSAAVLDADYTNSRFFWDGQSLTDEAVFLAAIGGSSAGNQRTIGPYVDPGATELIINGGLNVDLTGWTPVLNGTSTVAIASAAARLTSDGTAGNGVGGAGITQGFATTIDRAYRVQYDILLGTAGSRLGGTTPTAAGAVNPSRTAGVGYFDTFSADAATSNVYFYRNGAGAAAVNNVSVKECAPFRGFAHGGVSGEIAGITPPAASGNKAALSLATGANQDEAIVVYNASGELRIQTRHGGSLVADLNLGVVAVSTEFNIKFSLAQDGFYASLNDGIPVSDTTGPLPGFAQLFIGRSFEGNAWDGVINRVKIYPIGGAEQMYGLLASTIHAEGDSFIGGASGVVLPTTLQTVMARPVRNTGVGGGTATDIRNRLQSASAQIRSKPTVIWDGSENPISTLGEVPAYVATLAEGVASLGHDRFLIIPACANSGEVDFSIVDAIRAEMFSRWPNNTIDWRDFLTLSPAGYPADNMFVELPGDTTHLSQAAIDLAAAAIMAFITDKVW